MREPLFKNGQTVYHGRDKATVLSCINVNDGSDFKIQGYRYLVEHSGFTWSAPESSLYLKPANCVYGGSLPLAPKNTSKRT